jgi:hypothetical protein
MQISNTLLKVLLPQLRDPRSSYHAQKWLAEYIPGFCPSQKIIPKKTLTRSSRVITSYKTPKISKLIFYDLKKWELKKKTEAKILKD